MNLLTGKLKEVLQSVLPIVIIVVLLHFFITPLPGSYFGRFLIGALLLIPGLTIFLIGVDLGVSRMGMVIGHELVNLGKFWRFAILATFLGFLISIAEPDLHILAGQVEQGTGGLVNTFQLVIYVSIGVGIMIAAGLLRILYRKSIKLLFLTIYLIIFVLSYLANNEFIAFAFDASGATTGAMTVPFMLALAASVASRKKDSIASESDNFGLVGLASGGAIMGCLAMAIIMGNPKPEAAELIQTEAPRSFFEPFLVSLGESAWHVAVALLPVIIAFFVVNFFKAKLDRRELRPIILGNIYAYVGLVLFLAGVNGGFLDAARVIGRELATHSQVIILVVGFVVGLVTILAEPAVSVLTHNVRDITGGSVQRRPVLIALSLGVGAAVALSLLRILIPEAQLWHFLLPGYIIALGLMPFVPDLFVGMAFDSGGVASGPMTATFVLAFSQGVAIAVPWGDPLNDGFGIIAMVAMTPLIVLQLLGLLYKLSARRSRTAEIADLQEFPTLSAGEVEGPVGFAAMTEAPEEISFDLAVEVCRVELQVDADGAADDNENGGNDNEN
ncbi:MAG: DUF1538 domain-containing protein [Clostridiaceae bacterium]|nr:DUF1538 domain-containing protein [Clostridiaceae bacterium]